MLNFTELLAQKIGEKQLQLEQFFVEKFSKNQALIYNSVDIRHCGFKVAPVDTNCFPAGFNNLSQDSKAKSKELVKNYLSKNFPNAKKIVIIAENHSRNFSYLQNLLVLQEIFAENMQVRVAMIGDGVFAEFAKNSQNPLNQTKIIANSNQVEIELENFDKKQSLKIFRLKKEEVDLLAGDDFVADIALLNNDLTAGLPEILQNCRTAIFPSVDLGWFQRSKSHHFEIYQKLAQEVAKILEIDDWRICSFSKKVSKVNFKQLSGLENLALEVDKLLAKITEKYQEYGISEKPRCFIKADNGTYGMAVWLVESGEEVLKINKKERNKMNVIKGSVITNEVMIQEAISTIDAIEHHPCEPLIYIISGQVVANLFRCNSERDEKSSLNAPGAKFYDLQNLPEINNISKSRQNYSKLYWLIANLAAAAAAIESQNFI